MVKTIRARHEGPFDVRELAEQVVRYPHPDASSPVKVAMLPEDFLWNTVEWQDNLNYNSLFQLPKPYDLPWANPEWMPSAKEIREAAKAGFQGVVNNQALYMGYAVPLLLAEVSFVKSAPIPDLRVTSASSLFKDPSLVPFRGQVYSGGRELPEEEVDFSWLRDEEGAAVKFLAFCIGQRSVFFPTKRALGLPCDPRAPLGYQFKGVGMHYVNHFGRIQECSEGDVVVSCRDTSLQDVLTLQRTDYAGKTGLFLDVKYQPGWENPAGSSVEARTTFERSTALISNGLELGKYVVGGWDLTHGCDVVCEVWQAPTLVRLDLLSSALRSARADEFLGEVLARLYPEQAQNMTFEYLRELASNYGKIAKAALASNLVIPGDSAGLTNVTLDGYQVDLACFVPVEDWKELRLMFYSQINDLLSLSERLPSMQDLFTSAALPAYLGEFMSDVTAEEVLEVATFPYWIMYPDRVSVLASAVCGCWVTRPGSGYEISSEGHWLPAKFTDVDHPDRHLACGLCLFP